MPAPSVADIACSWCHDTSWNDVLSRGVMHPMPADVLLNEKIECEEDEGQLFSRFVTWVLRKE
eukprot:4869431-Amphidinium_carterae.1